jgi:hypothetical protein
MKRLSTIVISIVYAFNINASCDKPVTSLQKDQAAPCQGFLFTPEAEKDVRSQALDLELQKQINAAQERQIGLYKQETDILEEQRNLWKTQAEASTKALIESENNKSWEMFLWFGVGVAATTLITYGVNQR